MPRSGKRQCHLSLRESALRVSGAGTGVSDGSTGFRNSRNAAERNATEWQATVSPLSPRECVGVVGDWDWRAMLTSNELLLENVMDDACFFHPGQAEVQTLEPKGETLMI